MNTGVTSGHKIKGKILQYRLEHGKSNGERIREKELVIFTIENQKVTHPLTGYRGREKELKKFLRNFCEEEKLPY